MLAFRVKKLFHQILDPFLTHSLDSPIRELLNLQDILQDSSPPKVRTKRIPHEYFDFNEIDDSAPIYVTEDGDETDKISSSGPWTDWSVPSECSRSCGGGVASQARECEGECTGPDTRYFSCNTHACSDGVIDFRADQCSAFNNVPFEGRFYTWLPYTRAPNKCELNCMPQGERFYYRHKKKVIDGTSCAQDSICVNGNCLSVGCDGILGSRKRQDKCRVCGGDGSNCNTVQGIFDSNELQVGYNDVLLIPAGATNILVRETQATNNYLAIRNTSGHYYLNGNWRIDFPREIHFASTTFHYERKPHTFFAPETIRSLGPISEAIYVVVLYQEQNPGITFEYSVPKGVVVETEDGTEYAWIYDDWGECSRDCGGGTQNRNVNCARRSSSTLNWDYVEPHLCDSNIKPETFRYCNYEVACPVRWHVSTWDDCTAPCGSNITGTQYRNVFCEQEIQGVSALVENDKCVFLLGPAPDKLRNCTSTNTEECTYWFVGGWKGCSSLCGPGYNTRVVRCISKDSLGRIVIHGDEKCVGDKPVEYEYCFLGPCEGVDWIAEGKWGECKVPSIPTCNSPTSANRGTQSREVYCSDAKGKVYEENYCHVYRKPNTTQSCELDFNPAEDPSCKYTWYATQWTDCEFQSCSERNKGKRTRRVICGTVLNDNMSMKVVEEDNCNATKTYHNEEDCEISSEEVEKNCGDEEARSRRGVWFAGPWGECSKKCGGGRRTRAVLCMVGNRATTDVKICGEDDVIFTSEDCNPGSCDDLPADEESVTEAEEETSTVTEEPCEVDDYYDEYYDEEEEPMGITSPVTGRSTRSVDASTESTTDDVTEDMTESSATEDSSGATDTPMDDITGDTQATSEEGTTATGATDEMDTEATETSVTSETTQAGTTESVATGGSTEGVSVTTPGGTETTSGGVETTTGMDTTTGGTSTAQPTTTEGSMTTTDAATTTTEEPSTTSTEPPTSTTTEEPTTTTEEQTTTTEAATTTTESITTTTAQMTTTDRDVSTTTMGATDDGMSTTTSGGSEATTTLSSITEMDGSTVSGGAVSTEPPTTLIPPPEGGYNYDYNLEGAPIQRLLGGSTDSSSTVETGATEESVSEDMDEPVTEVEYITEEDTTDSTQAIFTSPEPVTLPRCKPKKPKPKPPTNCHKSKFGCCPDNYTSAIGPFSFGCDIAKTCNETEFGCCDDGVTPAENKRKRNCKLDCKASLFGCCEDGKTVAQGNNQEGCIKDCKETEFGCCLDGKTIKKGPKGKHCPKIPCSETIYGCCPDNKTPALGANFLNCSEINLENCKANFFGCCIDGTTAALGPNEEGCPDTPPCVRTEHGCCDDGVTGAHGPNKEGCCLSSRYGCCPDNINEALGPEFEGCTCASSPYGCCPDNITPARGPGPDCGCKFTEHGCCPDGVSPASGANHEGCACSTFQFGCCPDGVTVAKGVNDQGCGCQYTEFGCCPDNRTPKNSSESCGCESSQFGCCPDGVTHARGDEFESCEDVPIKPGDVCGLDKERGSCRNFTVRWFFDMEYGGCSRFWWGGCEGNLNKFATQDECKAVCVEPEGRDACYLPTVSGPCEGYYPSWHYDPLRDRCEQFIYSGCLGNNNRFGSRQECEHSCLMPEHVDDCDQPKTEGPCRGNYTRWYYDKSSEKCELFTYGGCKGNSNNFLTEKECHQRCGKDVRMRDVCFQSRSEGPCNEKLPRWYYDGGEQRCVPFYYSGCQGNSNRFSALDECEKTCPAALLAETHGCLDPLMQGDCASYTERYYFDRYEGKCKTFIYTGCGGNSNNFVHIDDCRSKCETVVPRPVATSEDQQFSQAHCFIPPPDPQSCSNSNSPPTIRWFYNSDDGVCYQFRYYCSNSSLNNFDTRQDCEDKCGSSQDFCNLPVVQGPCSGAFQQYYYERSTDECQLFDYSGCSGNGNRFDTVTQCEQRCKKHHEPVAPEPRVDDDEEAARREDDERRRAEEERRRYDEEERRRYEDEERRRIEEERRRYDEEQAKREHDTTLVTQDDICVLPVDQGPCRAAVKSWHFDVRERKCTEFLYGGCGGNANRFESQEMCERQCGEFRGQDVCNATPDPGPCTDSQSQKWYFNTLDNACAVFVYSGCEGNGNRFSSREECESVCHSRTEIVSGNDTITGAAICRLAPDSGPCVDGFKRWYYNAEDKTCIPFVFGGCAGNLNRFKSFDTCVNFCEKALGYTYAERSNPPNREQSPPRNSAEDPSRSNSVGDPARNYYYSDDGNNNNHYNAPCDCSYVKCPYGLKPHDPTESCDCECYDPCMNHICPESWRCSVDIQAGSYVPICRSARKPGSCPNLQQPRSHHSSICDNECSSDADCSGEMKCCVHGCGSSCVVPVFHESLPVSIVAKERVLNISEGSIIEMECTARGSPRPDILWVRVDSKEEGIFRKKCHHLIQTCQITGESGRYRIVEQPTATTSNSKLQVIGPTRDDSGEYSCIADSPSSPPRLRNHLSDDPRVEQPKRSLSSGGPFNPNDVDRELSSERYEQMRDYSLVIRLVSLRDLGAYTCQAYNGLGRAASWTITLLAYGPVQVQNVDDREYLVYVVDNQGITIPTRNISRVPTTTTTHTTTTLPPPIVEEETRPQETHDSGPNYLGKMLCPPCRGSLCVVQFCPVRVIVYVPAAHDDIDGENALLAGVRDPNPVRGGGLPPPSVHWYLNGVPIDLSQSSRVRYEPPELVIGESSSSDSGVYRCDAVNDYGASHSSISVSVEGMQLHPNCTDNSFFANCKLIVKANYCTNKYYARFCCKSCTLAGSFPRTGPPQKRLRRTSESLALRSTMKSSNLLEKN
ncbi:Papilin [Orchesella cincta]|uniref:Papilin n=1 Tax=Orchesella cincta TaxID=48709 RepID=A0A1D2MW91_ORCCI|nr:Papilin [Orchesella cincta]